MPAKYEALLAPAYIRASFVLGAVGGPPTASACCNKHLFGVNGKTQDDYSSCYCQAEPGMLHTIRDKSSRIFCDEGSLRHLLIPPCIWLKVSRIINRGSFERPAKSDLENLLASWRKTEIPHRKKSVNFCRG